VLGRAHAHDLRVRDLHGQRRDDGFNSSGPEGTNDFRNLFRNRRKQIVVTALDGDIAGYHSVPARAAGASGCRAMR